MGFDREDFNVAGRNCLIVAPVHAADGRPWIWRMEFFGHEPHADSVLLTKGFHVVYMDMQDMYGAPVAMKLMNQFYKFLVRKKKLNPKADLEGFSRGGLFAFNWAAANPGKVSSIYVDAPVCDFKSWPAGKGISNSASPSDWKKLMEVYGFKNEDDALHYTKNPIDNLSPIAAARIPILSVCGQDDKVVPMSENTNIVEERYKQLGGDITVIAKPNNDHHPHSLKDPAPIVSFILKSRESK